MCFTSINKDNIVIPMLDDNNYLLQKDFIFVSPDKSGQLIPELKPVYWGSSGKKTYVFVNNWKDIMCLRNNQPQIVEQVLIINNIEIHTGCTMTAGFHCHIKPKRKGVYFSMSDIRTHPDGIYYLLSLPVMVTRYNLQLCSQQDAVVELFYLPSPWRLEKVLTKTNLKEYTKWYEKWSKQLCQ